MILNLWPKHLTHNNNYRTECQLQNLVNIQKNKANEGWKVGQGRKKWKVT